MAVVASATGAFLTGGALAAGTVGAGLLGGAVLGAGAGALYSGITGDGNILNSALTGGLIGGAVGGLGAAAFGAPAGGGLGLGGASGAGGAAGSGSAFQIAPTAATSAYGGAAGAGVGVVPPASFLPSSLAAPGVTSAGGMTGYGSLTSSLGNLAPAAAKTTGMEMLGYGLAGTAAMSLLGGMNQPKIATSTGVTNPSNIRPYTYNPGSVTNNYPTTQYGANGLPIIDSRERTYNSPTYTSGTPYLAANGGLMSAGYAGGGDLTEEEYRKIILKNIKNASTKELEQTLGAMDEQQFLMKNMPNYAQAMRPSISSMVEGAQYGDRMAQSYGGQPRDINVMPRVQDERNYGGIASIGQQVDPNTRVNLMADLQRTPYDKNALESVRRVGAGIDRKIGKDANLAAYYEQDPMGRNKQGGVRYTQNFDDGGITYDPVAQRYSGLPSSTPATPMPDLPADVMASLTPQWQAANPNAYSYDPKLQRYGAGNPTMNQLNAFKAEQDRQAAEALAASQYVAPQYDGGGGANGGLMPYNLGSYSDGGRLLKGPGDGVSDDIPATIGKNQPARLADGEFVIPARIVSELGNGSTDAGAKRLYAMMDNIQAGRKKSIGKNNVAKDTKAKKHLLA
jgi:hypothetical protein